MPVKSLRAIRPPKWLATAGKSLTKPGVGADLATAAGLAAGAGILAPHVSGEHLPGWASAGVAAGSFAGLRRLPALRSFVRPLAMQGAVLKGVDMASRHNQGYSTLDPTSVESHFENKLQDAAGRAVDTMYSGLADYDKMSRSEFVASVRRRLQMQQLAKQQAAELFG